MNDDSEYDIEVDFSGDYKKFIEDEFRSTISSYRARPDNIRENAGQEDAIVQGGYSGKQVQELVQNAADVVREGGSRIHVVCSDSTLYVANDGKPFDSEGIKTLLHSNMSTKRGDQIGRFGLGFKSVLEICGRPEIFSSTIAFGFDSERSTEILSQITPSLSLDPPIRLMARGSLGFECERGARAGSSVPVSHRSLPHR
ncbi:ATP-binding protein [Brevibacterium linens]|uniref:ATP-binding protein n=1 Tax=Brevibacterium linens TaxID=1703 RepID=UPI000FCCC62F|nr:ATP-binding protein [Brevibacterium linens]